MADAKAQPPELRKRAITKNRDKYGRLKNLPTARENVGVRIQDPPEVWYVIYPDINLIEGPFTFIFARDKARKSNVAELATKVGDSFFSVAYKFERGLRFARKTQVRAVSEEVARVVKVPVEAPDDPADGSAVLNAAIAAAPEYADLVLEDGIYDLSSEVYLKNGQRIRGSSDQVLVRRSPFRIRAENVNDIEFRDVTFDINSQSNFDEVVRAINVKGLVFKNCTWTNTGVFNPAWTIHAVLADDFIEDMLVEDCYIEGGQMNIGKTSAKNIVIRRCVFDAPMQYAISYVTRGTAALGNILLEDLTINNVFTSGAIYIGDDDSSGSFVSEVRDVVVRRCTVTSFSDAPTRMFNLRPHSAYNWLLEDLTVLNPLNPAGNSFSILLSPRRPGGFQSGITLRNIDGDSKYGALSLSGDLAVYNLEIENVTGSVYNGVNLSTVENLLEIYGRK